ncbi:MAG: protein kinase domain-containing protein [Candidatus Brocadiia bacterium]
MSEQPTERYREPLPEGIEHYRLLRALGRGGMGQVYLAEDPLAGNRRVAIKSLPISDCLPPAKREGLRVRLRQEAHALGQVDHPAIPKLYHVIEKESAFHIVMEYVEGHTLAELVGRGETFTQAQVVAIATEALGALAAAHAKGLLHRDVKPSNIMVTPSGEVKLIDFGLAKGMDAEAHITRTDATPGTPGYMAPEQVAGNESTAASDQFCLGIVLYELLAGQRPFRGRTNAELAFSILYEAPADIRELAPDLPEGLARTVMRALAKEPSQRFPSAGAMAEALQALAGQLPDQPAEGARRLSTVVLESISDGSPVERRSHARTYAVAAAVCLAAVLVGLFAHFRPDLEWRRPAEEAPAVEEPRREAEKAPQPDPRAAYRAARDRFAAIEPEVDVELTEKWLPGALAKARRLAEQAEQAAADERYGEAAAHYAQARQALEQAGQAVADAPAYEAARASYERCAGEAPTPLIARWLPEKLQETRRAAQAAEELARDLEFADAAARLARAEATLAEAHQSVRQAPDYEAARQSYRRAADEANEPLLQKWCPGSLQEAEDAADEAQRLAEQLAFQAAAARCAQAQQTLAEAARRAQALERGFQACEQARKAYAQRQEAVDAALVEKWLPQALQDARGLAAEGARRAAERDFATAAKKYAAAERQLADAHSQAKKLDQQARACQQEAQEYEQASRAADAGLLGKWAPDRLAEARRQARDAAASAERRDFAEATALYAQARRTLEAATQRAKTLEAQSQTCEQARARYLARREETDTDFVAAWLPDRLEAARKHAQEAERLAEEQHFEAAAAHYDDARQALGEAEPQAAALAQQAAQKHYQDVLAEADPELVARWLPERMAEARQLAAEAQRLAREHKAKLAAEQYRAAGQLLAAAHAEATELEGAFQDCQAARTGYQQALGGTSRRLAEIYLHGALAATDQLAQDAEALAEKRAFGPAAAKFAQAEQGLRAAREKLAERGAEPLAVSLGADLAPEGKPRPQAAALQAEVARRLREAGIELVARPADAGSVVRLDSLGIKVEQVPEERTYRVLGPQHVAWCQATYTVAVAGERLVPRRANVRSPKSSASAEKARAAALEACAQDVAAHVRQLVEERRK